MIRPVHVAVLILTLLLAETTATAGGAQDLLKFGASMAAKGNWREARYRWEQADRAAPDNPRILNNLAVANEALGEFERAGGYYERALRESKGDSRIADNAARAARFLNETFAEDAHEYVDARNEKLKGSKVKRLSVSLPIPPRLDVTGKNRLLVASFLADGNDMLDPSHEMVRFLRSELRKHTSLEILPVTPPPAVPEQSTEDMVRNRAFWNHLGREFEADLVVSGVLGYDRRDASGFEDVDVVSPTTGQKVRETRFVEQERFSFALQVFFFDGATGDLLHRERFKRNVVFRGLGNDPLTAFFELSDRIVGDILAVVSTRKREEPRVIFKN